MAEPLEERDVSRLTPYVPRVASEWDLDAPGKTHRRVDGTLVFVDISGFTALSEKLAQKGRIGAEELTEILDSAFGDMMNLSYERGGSLLKFGGDALLLMFRRGEHAVQACSAAVEMRSVLRRSPGNLRMSIGIHTGAIDFFRVGTLHRELIVTGPVASGTARMESAASAGEILVSSAVASALPKGSIGSPKGPGHLLKWRSPRLEGAGIVPRRPVPADAVAMSLEAGLRDHLSQAKAESEHRFATVGFVSFSGVDALIEQGAEEVAAPVIEALVAGIQEAAADEQVTFLASDIYTDGGKVLLTAGVPHTREDDEGRMLRTLRKIADLDTPLTLQLGANRGHMFSGDVGTEFRRTYTIEGDAVNLAARLMAAAAPGEIYVEPGVLARSRTLFETKPVPPFYAKGKSAPVRAFAMGQETGTSPAHTHRGLPFTGRVEELALIRTSLTGSDRGDGGVVTIVGDTGIGKSRLVNEAMGELSPSLAVLGEPNSAANPYRPLRDPLRRALGIERTDQATMRQKLGGRVKRVAPDLVDDLPLIGDALHIEVPETGKTRLIEPQFRPARVADAVLRLLEALFPGQMIAVAEDAHWFDPGSAGVFSRIAAASQERRWLVLATRRPSDGGFDPDVGMRIELGPLTAAESRRAVIDATASTPLRPDQVQAIVDRAGGNPMFLEEIVKGVTESGGLDDLPTSLEAVVGAEIDALPSLARRLLRYASVLGQSFRPVVLDRLLAEEDMQVDTATRRALARFIDLDEEGRYRFRHAVARDAAYQSLTYRIRRELHARAGRVIEGLAGPDIEEVAPTLGMHFAAAARHDKAWHYSLIAGDTSRQAYANTAAATHYERALDALRRSGDHEVGDEVSVLTSLGDVLELAGRFDRSLRAYRSAGRLISGNHVASADLHLKCARVLLREGRYRQALVETTKGIRRAEEDRTASAMRATARLNSFAAVVRMGQEHPLQARTLAERAVELAENSDEPEALARAYLVLDWADWATGAADAGTRGKDALAIYTRLEQPDQAADILNNLGAYAYFDGRWTEAVDWYQQSRDSFRQAGNEVGAALVGANIAEVLISQGRWVEAEPALMDALHVLRGSGATDDALFAETLHGRLLTAKGEPETAVRVLTQLKGSAEELGRGVSALEISVCLADALRSKGDRSDALVVLDEAERSAGEKAIIAAASAAMVRASTLAELGRVDDSMVQIEQGLAVATAQGLAYQEHQLRSLRMSLDGERGPDDEVRVRALADQLGIVG